MRRPIILCILALGLAITGVQAVAPPVIQKDVKVKIEVRVTLTSETQVFSGGKRIRISELPDEGEFHELHIKDGKVLKIIIEPLPPRADL